MATNGLYETAMAPDDALEATDRLSTVLLLDIPPGTQVGLDSQCFVVGEKFKGVKMLPPGVHFLSTNSSSPDSVSAPVSFFHCYGYSEILIRRWNHLTEQLERMEDADQEERLRHGVRNYDFDDGLAPYDISHWRQWKRLCGWLEQKTIDRLMNGHPFISIAEEARGIAGLSPSIPSEAALINQLQSQQTTPASEKPQKLNYNDFPLLIKKTGCSASELSSMNLDKTHVLQEILKNRYDNEWKDLLGEIQFSFISFIFGQSLQGLEQWKRMLHLLLGCFEGIPARKDLFGPFLKLVRHQLVFLLDSNRQEMEDVAGFLTDSFLKTDLTEFVKFELTEGCGSDLSIRRESNKLASLMKEKLQWNVDDVEDDEYAPVVVL